MDQHYADLIKRWREEAATYERDGQPGAAMLRRVAAQLETCEQEQGQEQLTLAQAAAESGRHKDTIARYIDEGELENVGKKGSPLVRRGDLLAKLRKPSPRKKTLQTTTSGPQLVQGAMADQGIGPPSPEPH